MFVTTPAAATRMIGHVTGMSPAQHRHRNVALADQFDTCHPNCGCFHTYMPLLEFQDVVNSFHKFSRPVAVKRIRIDDADQQPIDSQGYTSHCPDREQKLVAEWPPVARWGHSEDLVNWCWRLRDCSWFASCVRGNTRKPNCWSGEGRNRRTLFQPSDSGLVSIDALPTARTATTRLGSATLATNRSTRRTSNGWKSEVYPLSVGWHCREPTMHPPTPLSSFSAPTI